MLRDAGAGRFDVVMSWAIDRLGRSVAHLAVLIDDLQAQGVGLYLHQQAIDSTTASGKAMLQMCGVFAEFERSILRERIHAGIARARQQGTKSGKALGRPRIEDGVRESVRAARAEGKSVRVIARELGLSVGSVHRMGAG
jgi:DNA invertase Pin-like site-specific DNA recombinase